MARAAGQMACAWLDSLADVDDRELFAEDGAGSARGWLKQQPCGDAGQLSLARRLQVRAVVHDALGAGSIGVSAAASVCQSLTAIDDLEAGPIGAPTPLPEAQVIGVLTGAVPQALQVWAGWQRPAVGADPVDLADLPPVVPTPGLADDVRNERLGRRELLAHVLLKAASATGAPASERLEPVLTLLARALSPHALANALSAILDALAPERLEAELPEPFVECSLRPDGMWDVRGLLEAEDGEVFAQELLRRMRLHAGSQDEDLERSEPKSHSDAPASEESEPVEPVEPVEPAAQYASSAGHAPQDEADPAGADVADTADGGAVEADAEPAAPAQPALFDDDPPHPLWGRTGPGIPSLPPDGSKDAPVEGGAALGRTGNARYLALRSLLYDAMTASVGSGAPPPAKVTIIATAEFAAGIPGAQPAQIRLGRQLRHLSATALRRKTCDGLVAAVILDAEGQPIGASGTHRHATDRERRALQARWGLSCAVNGCCDTQTVPHHVEMFSRTGITRLDLLIPLCTHHHRAIHEGKCTLRLRDGRYLDEEGWIDQSAQVA